jgi:hypothetical protein
MNKFYVRDVGNIKYFNSVPEVISFLEKVVQVKLHMSRPQWMQHVVDLGHGNDEPTGNNFVNSLSEQVEIGAVQKDGKHVRCNIFEATGFSKEEYGD